MGTLSCVVGRLKHKTALESSWLLNSKLSFRFAERVVAILTFVAVTPYLEIVFIFEYYIVQRTSVVGV